MARTVHKGPRVTPVAHSRAGHACHFGADTKGMFVLPAINHCMHGWIRLAAGLFCSWSPCAAAVLRGSQSATGIACGMIIDG